MLRDVIVFLGQVSLMAYMCILQFLPRSARQFFPCGKFRKLSPKSGQMREIDLSGKVAIVTGANSGVGLVFPSKCLCVRDPD
jgi:hypothetical protein